MLSPRLDKSSLGDHGDSREALIDLRLKTLESIPTNPLCILLEVLVAMCGALKHEDFVRLGPFVWDQCLDLQEAKTSIHVSLSHGFIDGFIIEQIMQACFLCMQYAEKANVEFQRFLFARLQR